MGELVHADIFFFITSIAVIALSVGAVMVIIYVLKILREVKEITDVVKKEAESVSKDFEQLRLRAKQEKSTLSVLEDIWRFIRFFYKKNKKVAHKK